MSISNGKEISQFTSGNLTKSSKLMMKLIYEIFKIKFKIQLKENVLDDYDSQNSIEEDSIDDINSDVEENEDEENPISEDLFKNTLTLSCIGYQLDNKNRIEG